MRKLENAEQNLRLSTAARAKIRAALEEQSAVTKHNKIPMRFAAAAAAVVLTAALLTTGVLHRPSAQPTAENAQTEMKTAIRDESLRLCITQMQASGQRTSTELQAGSEVFVEPTRQEDNHMLYALEVEALDIAVYNRIYVQLRGFNDDVSPDTAVTNADWQLSLYDENTETRFFGVYTKSSDGAQSEPQEYVFGCAEDGKFYVTAPSEGETVVYTVTVENEQKTVSLDLRLRAVDGKVGVTVENTREAVN